MKKVLILTAGYGGGHNAAAQALAHGFLQEGISEENVKVVDLLQSRYGKVNEIFQKAYLAAVHRVPLVWGRIYRAIDSSEVIENRIAGFPPLRRAMELLLDLEQPDAVVSTFPVYNCLMASLEQKGRTRRFGQFTVVTDSISVNAIWYRKGSDLFFVPNQATADVVAKGGIPMGQIRPLGFPVASPFASAASGMKTPPQGGERWRVLYALQPWQVEGPEIVRGLLSWRGLELTVTVAGGNEALRKRVEAVEVEGRRAEVYGRTSQMPQLMARAHLLIGKAGGAMVHEALAGRTPMLVTQVIPGQEEGNARLLVEHGCGAVVEASEIPQRVCQLFESGDWLGWYQNTLPLSYPHAARDVAREVLAFS